MEHDLLDLIASHNLNIDIENESFASKFVNIEGYKENKSKERVLMKTWKDGYLLSLWIGIKSNTRKKDFKSKEKARTLDRKSQYLYLISQILSKKEVLIELDLESIDAIKNSGTNVKMISDKLKRICDEFAFGGLEYIKELYEKDEEIFDDPGFFEKIFKSFEGN